MDAPQATIAVFGASGLIGGALTEALLRAGYRVVPIARRFTPAQKGMFAAATIEVDFTRLGAQGLLSLLSDRSIDIVINCAGVLQDGPRGRTDDVNRRFVEDLMPGLKDRAEPVLFIQISLPGRADDDRTGFSRSKREAEQIVASSGLAYVILRPGFVVAPVAYGGGAIVRALAAAPASLPRALAGRPFATTHIADLERTAAFLVGRWRQGERTWRAVWEVMERRPTSLGEVVETFRHRFGGPAPIVRAPFWVVWLSARLGDMIAMFGWSPPLRTTALRELLRGVEGDPQAWIVATGLEPTSLADALARLPSTIQEAWFARLFLIKPLVFVALSLFWTASGLIALGPGFDGAAAILISHGFPPPLGQATAALSSLADTGVGLMIAWRPTCRAGLLAGICLSAVYLAGAAIITPELWVEPLGALMKTVPAIVLMLVALAILPDR